MIGNMTKTHAVEITRDGSTWTVLTRHGSEAAAVKALASYRAAGMPKGAAYVVQCEAVAARVAPIG